jgi:hypothetical protein
MNVNFPPESLVDQESGTKNVLANLNMKVDSNNFVCSEKYFFSWSHSLASPQIMIFNSSWLYIHIYITIEHLISYELIL